MKHIVLLYGEDSFRVREKLNTWKTAFIEKYGGDINMDELEGKTVSSNEILNATQALPFLSEKRLLIVKHFLRDGKTDEQKACAERLDQIPESCTLVFVENEAPDKRTKLFKALKKSCRLDECAPLTGPALIDWIQRQAQSNGSSIDRSTAHHLVERTEGNAWKLYHEIAKLSTYAGDEPITRIAIDELVVGQMNPSIFKLTDALGQKNTQEALKLLQGLIEGGEPIPRIFSMLARQIRILLQILDTQKTTPSPKAIASKLKQHPFAISSTLPQCRNFSIKELQSIYDRLLAIDRGLKTGAFKFTAADPREYQGQIEKFIVETCEGRRS